MNIYSFLSVITFTLTTVFGFLALVKLKGNRNSIMFLLVSLSLSLYSLGYSFSYSAPDEDATRFWYRIALSGLIIFPVMVLQLSLLITNPKFRMNLFKIFLLSIPAIVLMYRNFTANLYAVSFRKTYSFGTPVWVPRMETSDFWSTFLIIYCVVYALYAFGLFINWRKSSNSRRIKKITNLILLTVLFAFPLIIFTNVIAPAYQLKGVVDIAHISTLGVYFTYYYAIHKYSFLKVTPDLAVDNILSSAKDLIILTDLDNNINSINQHTRSLVGYSCGDPAGKNIYEIFVRNDNFNNYLVSSEFAESGMRIETELITCSGELIPVSLSAALIKDEFGEPMAKILIGSDTSDKIRLQELLDSREKLISIIAHDLRGPIGNSLSTARTIKELDDLTDEELEELKDIQISSLEKTLNLLEDLLLWAKSGIDIPVISKTNFDLGEVLTENINLLQPFAHSKNISINFTIPTNFVVYADRNMISTVVRNILSNAIKFTYEYGTVECVPIQQENHRGISFIDNGKGITQTQLENIFEIEKKSKVSGSGSGLGLVVCKEFISKNNGIIWAERGEKEGSKFSFIIPTSSTE